MPTGIKDTCVSFKCLCPCESRDMRWSGGREREREADVCQASASNPTWAPMSLPISGTFN